jgi:hypothetical protein
MKATQVTITFSKRVSDGNYGHEGADIFMAAEVADGENPEHAAESLLASARVAAHNQLANSPNLAIRRSLQRQEPRQAREDEL